MKGQYFSFDAVIATVIMVVAITSLAAYWFGVQAVVELRNNPMYADALRIAESLASPGSPANWTLYATGNPEDLNQVRQIGLASDFGGALSRDKIKKLSYLVQDRLEYNETRRIMRATGEYYILIEHTDDANEERFGIGVPPSSFSPSEVAIAHRGAVLEGRPMRITVYLSRK